MNDMENLYSKFNRGEISRRRLLQLAASVGGLGALQTLGIPGLNPVAMAAEPKRGGHVRFGIGSGSTTDSLDPITINSTFMQLVNYGLRNNLTEITPSGELVPELCESWDHNKNATAWTFKLRKGIEFHNGKTLDAKDVVATIKHNIGKDSKSPLKASLKIIDEVKADDKSTVLITLSQGNADLAYLMSDYLITICPLTKDGLDTTSGNGTGGYILETFEPGVHASMKRHPNYWKTGAAHFDSATVLAQKDSTSRINALATGQIDVMNRVPLNAASMVQSRAGMRVVQASGNQQITLPMRVDKPPFHDNNVRLAFKHAIDRKNILQNILYNHGYLGNDNPIGNANRYQDKSIDQFHYDPDKARHYLKKAGMDNVKVDLKVSDAPFQGAVDMAVLFKGQAKKAGIDINIEKVPADGYWTSVWLKAPFCVAYWGGRPTADWMFSVGYSSGAPWNATHWKNERFNKLLKEARSETNQDKRVQMYDEMQQLVHDKGGVIIPAFLNYVMALRDNVKHNKIANNWGCDGLKAIERWWMV